MITLKESNSQQILKETWLGKNPLCFILNLAFEFQILEVWRSQSWFLPISPEHLADLVG
jgi:hypothetical protein